MRTKGIPNYLAGFTIFMPPAILAFIISCFFSANAFIFIATFIGVYIFVTVFWAYLLIRLEHFIKKI